ncbi:hypothetical protein DICSQDRAFT_169120 [Dichomitus squalens LYAD-421 SS1]|uniref:uncharacterized protein n=1 Tax=Dichomitus squalens (strain LYAD-421) TaxID=732165 RepID=UPI0004415D83|nr:uncharacterized protein DICSQDRAFT_169120 [Dichomitus squalens LYAD-421 SS1]EJF62731.1 hypothetical protein DICSQDRAFT_169120 [Dichomitus squalens LYAD-421 SS1]
MSTYNPQNCPALFFYDYVLTFWSEGALFWKPCRVNAATVLFLLNRYIPLAYQILNILPDPRSFKRYVYFSTVQIILVNME